MIPQFGTNLTSSFYLWAEDRLTRVGGAIYTGQEQTFTYRDSDDCPSNMLSFYADSNQFVFNGTGVPNYVTIDGTTVYQGNLSTPTGLLIDHEKARILVGTGFSTDVAITGHFDTREINIYMTQDDEDAILLSRDFIIDGESFRRTKEMSADEAIIVPAIIVTHGNGKNKAFALGGEQMSEDEVRVVVISDSNQLLDSVQSLFQNAKDKHFRVFDQADFPLGEFSHVKEPPYTYTGIADAPISWGYISDVVRSKLDDRVRLNISLPKNLKVGFLDFTVETSIGVPS